MHLVMQFVWRERWPKVKIQIDLWAMETNSTGWSRNWKAHNWKMGDKEV